MSFRATILVGNKKWKIGIGVSKWPDVQAAVSKASREAYKNMFIVPITGNQTVPYSTTTKYKACVIKILPATAGTGLKAGSSVRAVLELAGFENVLSKIMWSNNKLNNAMAAVKALSSYKHADHFNKRLVQKVKHEDTEEKAERTREVSSAVTEIQAKQSVWIVPGVVIKKVPVEILKDGKMETLKTEKKEIKIEKKEIKAEKKEIKAEKKEAKPATKKPTKK